jgi:hypothetical protein
VPPAELAAYAAAARARIAPDPRARQLFWQAPVTLARIHARELLRFRLVRAGLLPALDNSG